MEQPRAKILVVDDTKTNIDVLEGALSPLYDVIVAMNGQKAIKLALKVHPDLILLDVMMGEMSGFQLAKELKKNPKAKLLLVGNGPLQDEIKSLVQDKGLEKAVVFVGLQKSPTPFYCAMDALILPSIREALGIVLVEAQYCGLPCVVSEAVPDEAKISKNFVKIDLDHRSKWVDCLLDVKPVNRVDLTIDTCAFNIRNKYTLLENMYKN